MQTTALKPQSNASEDYAPLSMTATQEKQRLVQLVQEMRPELLKFLVNKLSNNQDAEDILQDLYLRVSDLKSEQVDALEHPKRYIYRISSNLAIDLIRKRQRHSNIYVEDVDTNEAPHAGPSLESILQSQREAELLREIIDNLPARCRQVFTLYKFRNIPQKQIAEELGISVMAVEKHIVRALKQCRDGLQRHG